MDYFKKVINKIIHSVKSSGLNLVVKGHPRMDNSTKAFKEKKRGFKRSSSWRFNNRSLFNLISKMGLRRGCFSLVDLFGHEIPEPINELATKRCSIENFSKELKNLDKSRIEDLKKK